MARLPHVRNARSGEEFNAATLRLARPGRHAAETQVELVASPDGLFTSQDRLVITQGRAADPARLDEVVATTEAAAVLHLHVGSRILVGMGSERRAEPGVPANWT